MLKDLFYSIIKEAKPELMEISGRNYTTKAIFPVLNAEPRAVEVETLTGVADYLNCNIDCLQLDSIFCHVESYDEVSIKSGLYGDFAQRKTLMVAKLNPLGIYFGDYVSAEKFNIMLQSCFVDDPDTDRAKVLAYSSNVKEASEGHVLDDGITQAVTVKKGIASVENTVLPNPVILRPYRTFVEIEQPASKFVFRAKEGPRFGLFEADGGAWKNEAMLLIKKHMEAHVPGLIVIA